MIYVSLADHHAAVHAALERRPALVCLSTYGVWAGVAHDGGRTETPEAALLERLVAVPQTRVLVGVPEFRACRLGCPDCEVARARLLLRTVQHAHAFPRLRWRVAARHHVKCVLMAYPDGSWFALAGGRNLTGSDWADFSIDVSTHGAELFATFATCWRTGAALDDAAVERLLREAGVREHVLQLL